MARLIEVERALGHRFEPATTRYDERDLALYALATGAADDPADDRQLRRAFEGHPAGIDPLPGFFAVMALNTLVAALRQGKQAPGLNYGIERVLHAEQKIELFAPLRPKGTMSHAARVAAIYDKGRHGLVVTEVESKDERGELVLKSTITSLVRSAGGFGGPRGEERAPLALPERAPDAVVEQATQKNQALLFRLLGDDNPLHADPGAARTFGLKQPILHGMCTFGFALRHVVDACAGGDSGLVRSADVRFADVVFPGETLVTEMWRDGDRVQFQTKVKERDKVVLSLGVVTLGALAARAASGTEEVRAAVEAIRAHVAARPALTRTIGACFQVRLHEPDVDFFIDLRRDPAVVREGVAADADVGIELRAKDFFALKEGTVLGRALYMTGAMKMTGKTSLAPHLDFLREVTSTSATAFGGSLARPSASAADLDLDLAAASQMLSAPVVVALVTKDEAWTIVLGPGAKVTRERVASADATIRLDGDDLRALASGERSLEWLFMHGRARIDGDMRAARAIERAFARPK